MRILWPILDCIGKLRAQLIVFFIKVVRNEIDEINAGAHDNMTYEEIAKEMITQIILGISHAYE